MSGLTAIEVVILVAAVIVIALLVLMEINRVTPRHRTSASNSCMNNLRLIDAAKEQWKLENNVTNLSVIPTPADLQLYMGRGSAGSLPWCPLDTKKSFTNSYIVNDLKTPPACRFTNQAPHHALVL